MNGMSGFDDVSLQLSLLGWMGLAVLLGGAVGAERKRAHRAAGTRTHMLVSGATCLITQIGAHAALDAGLGDPTRGMHAAITSIGFIGGGAIFMSMRNRPTGVTTAASVLFVAAIGAAVALGFGVLAFGATVMTLLTLRGVKKLESWLGSMGDDDEEDDDDQPRLEVPPVS